MENSAIQIGNWVRYSENKPESVKRGSRIESFVVWESLAKEPRIAHWHLDRQFYYGGNRLNVDWWMSLPDEPNELADGWLKYPSREPDFGDRVLVYRSQVFYVCVFSENGFSSSSTSGSVRMTGGPVIWLPLPEPPDR